MMALLIPNGVFAEVSGHKIHIFRAGDESSPKLVFLSASGTAAPAYDFKILYTKLTERFRVIVIEKFGYGYSDIYECPTDIDSRRGYSVAECNTF